MGTSIVMKKNPPSHSTHSIHRWKKNGWVAWGNDHIISFMEWSPHRSLEITGGWSRVLSRVRGERCSDEPATLSFTQAPCFWSVWNFTGEARKTTNQQKTQCNQQMGKTWGTHIRLGMTASNIVNNNERTTCFSQQPVRIFSGRPAVTHENMKGHLRGLNAWSQKHLAGNHYVTKMHQNASNPHSHNL